MMNPARFFIYLFIIIFLTGCSCFKSGKRSDKTGRRNRQSVALPVYTGARARISLGNFEVQALKSNAEFAQGLREMLLTALAKTNRFHIETSESPEGSQKGKDLIIAVAVAEFEPQVSGGRGGLGGGGGVASGMLGGLLGNYSNKAHLALDIRVIDGVSSQILGQLRVQGQASEKATATQNGMVLPSKLNGYADTPMEKAIRICIIESVRYITEAVPQSYYKY